MRKHSYKIRIIIAVIVFVSAVSAIIGFYPVKIMDIQFLALFQRMLTTHSIAAIGLLIFLVLITIIFGRFYCSTICPFGILQEITALVIRRKKSNTKLQKLPLKYFICALTFGCLLGGSAILIRYIDPYTIFGALISISTFGILFTLAVLAIVKYKNRYFCTNICPVGVIFGLCSKYSINTINIDEEKCISCKMCERNCQAGCIDINNKKVDNEICIKCLKCVSICPKNAINYGKRQEKINFTRREAIIGLSSLAILTGGIALGVKFAKETAKKVKDVIFPAGAINANRIANRCLNCNLCINNCPNSIIVKADDNFNTIHIDYKKGKKYCEYDCNKCVQVCPSGAIKRISLEEKQNTRIAMASINQEKCRQCTKCISECPKKAITGEIGQSIIIDGSKCIGCGRCAVSCKFDAIEIFGIKEQSLI